MRGYDTQPLVKSLRGFETASRYLSSGHCVDLGTGKHTSSFISDCQWRVLAISFGETAGEFQRIDRQAGEKTEDPWGPQMYYKNRLFRLPCSSTSIRMGDTE
jgi:hypothetical protein